MSDALEIKYFRDISLDDPFFDSLKSDYKEFPEWYEGKADQTAYVQYTGTQLSGFMYPKIEDEPITDVNPPMPAAKRIKIGTLKVEAHGTKLGERLIKKAIDHAVIQQAEEMYITIFPHHTPLINLINKFGFNSYGDKTTDNGTELVLVKRLSPDYITGDIRKDYPIIDTRDGKFYLLGIYPQYHSQLFPDSLLDTESYDILSDVSHTNSISKTYICAINDATKLISGDKIVIYRTSDKKGPAEYRSVATSVCVVEEIKERTEFHNVDQYLSYTQPFSVLSERELKNWWANSNSLVIKMLYNAALTKKLIRKDLADQVGLYRDEYWGFMPLSRDQFLNIVKLGGVNERLVVR